MKISLARPKWSALRLRLSHRLRLIEMHWKCVRTAEAEGAVGQQQVAGSNNS